jgi:hypothetical protein
MRESRTHSVSTNGPAPTGFLPTSSPYRASAAGETIVPRLPVLNASANTDANEPNGSASVNSTVSGSTPRIDAIRCA